MINTKYLKIIILIFIFLFNINTLNASENKASINIKKNINESKKLINLKLDKFSLNLFYSLQKNMDSNILPPHPNSIENSKTVKGIDFDKDGIRDDGELKISSQFSNDSFHRNSALHLFKGYSNILNLANKLKEINSKENLKYLKNTYKKKILTSVFIYNSMAQCYKLINSSSEESSNNFLNMIQSYVLNTQLRYNLSKYMNKIIVNLIRDNYNNKNNNQIKYKYKCKNLKHF